MNLQTKMYHTRTISCNLLSHSTFAITRIRKAGNEKPMLPRSFEMRPPSVEGKVKIKQVSFAYEVCAKDSCPQEQYTSRSKAPFLTTPDHFWQKIAGHVWRRRQCRRRPQVLRGCYDDLINLTGIRDARSCLAHHFATVEVLRWTEAVGSSLGTYTRQRLVLVLKLDKLRYKRYSNCLKKLLVNLWSAFGCWSH